MKKTLALLCAIILLAGCTNKPKVDIAAETGLINNIENQWVEAFKASDVEKIASFFATEGVSMSTGFPVAIGPENIRIKDKKQFADTTLLFNTYASTTDIIEISASGDLAYARGHDEISKKTKDGLVKSTGKWVDIYKKVNGEWKAIVSIGNSDNP